MVSFWDASAAVALCVREVHSDAVWVLAERDREFAVWWGTRVECTSALARRSREGLGAVGSAAQEELAALASDWVEVEPSAELRDSAERLLWQHPLRAADAFQLAAALRWCEGRPQGAGFVCLDGRLREAARIQGFRVLPEP